MKAAEFISVLKTRGIDLWQEAGALRYRAPAGVLTDREKVTLRAHKATILEVLGKTHPPPPAPIAGSTAVVAPPVRECRNCARFEPYPFEPILGSCYALQRMQNAGSKPARFGCSHFEPKEGRS